MCDEADLDSPPARIQGIVEKAPSNHDDRTRCTVSCWAIRTSLISASVIGPSNASSLGDPTADGVLRRP